MRELDKNEIIIENLKQQKEIIPDKHDGSYEMMRETIYSYKKLKDISVLNYKDLNLVYIMSVGTWKIGIEKRKYVINESNLSKKEKVRLIDVMDRLWQNAIYGKYENDDMDEPSLGMFGTGFFNFKDKTDDDTVRRFINLCVEIIDIDDDNEIFDKAEKVLDENIHGMKAASASMILHCLKPYTFPIFNSNMGIKNIFEKLGVVLDKKKEIYTYIKNCRAVKEFRDKNVDFKNYRVFDLFSREIIDEVESEDINYYYDNNLILYGPPGTGKTYNTVNYAVAICDEENINDLEDYNETLNRYNQLKKDGRIEFITFHQSYGYEEFIEGISPKTKNGNLIYKLKNGIFKSFCKKALEDDETPYVFIIDEINRGNISKIFGELITLIEDSKRLGNVEEMNVILPYSGESFGVPNNVYMIGTMNTADRSIALIDTALRRRFKFIEMLPNADILRNAGADIVEYEDEQIDVANMLEIINERIEYLYDREHTIGHAFFMDIKYDNSIESLASIFQMSIIPLLQEYFYEDYSKIQLILGDNYKSSDEYKFILDENVVIKDIFNGNLDDIDLPERKYKIQEDAFYNINSYKEIGTGI